MKSIPHNWWKVALSQNRGNTNKELYKNSHLRIMVVEENWPYLNI